MAGVFFPLSCPLCGGSLSIVASGHPVAGRQASVVVRCMSCASRTSAEWVLLARLVQFGDLVGTRAAPTTSCGSEGGYRRHLRAEEAPCDACRGAHATALAKEAASKRRGRPRTERVPEDRPRWEIEVAQRRQERARLLADIDD